MAIDPYHAARTGAAVISQHWMSLLRLSGPDRVNWLQGMVTNDVEKLAPGNGCYAAHLSAQGKMVSQMTVLATEQDIWLIVERVAAAKLAATFDKLIIMEDVQVHDASDEYEVIGVTGPHSHSTLEAFAEKPVPTALYAHSDGGNGRIVVSDLGYQIIVPRASASTAMQSLVAAGAITIDEATWNVLRTEAGLPLYGVDIDEATTLPELGQRGIDYDKGCYIGQEVVARIKYIGHVNRRFVGFLCEGPEVPARLSTVSVQGKEVGYLTTAVFSPGIGKAIALGFVNRSAAEPATRVDLAGGGNSLPAQVHALPFTSTSSGD